MRAFNRGGRLTRRDERPRFGFKRDSVETLFVTRRHPVASLLYLASFIAPIPWLASLLFNPLSTSRVHSLPRQTLGAVPRRARTVILLSWKATSPGEPRGIHLGREFRDN